MPRGPNRMMRWFGPAQPDDAMREISDLCTGLAGEMDVRLMESAEKTSGLRKLLEAKDCFERAFLETEEQRERDRRVLGDDGEVH